MQSHFSWRTLFSPLILSLVAAVFLSCIVWLAISDFDIVRKAPAKGYWTGGYIAKSEGNNIVKSVTTSFRMQRRKADIDLSVNRLCKDGNYYQDIIKIEKQRLPAQGNVEFEQYYWFDSAEDGHWPTVKFKGTNKNDKIKGTLYLGAKYVRGDVRGEVPIECERAIVPFEIVQVGAYQASLTSGEGGLYSGITSKESPISLYQDKDGHIKHLISSTQTTCTLNGHPLSEPSYFVVNMNKANEVATGVIEDEFQTKGEVFTKPVKKPSTLQKIFREQPSPPKATSVQANARVRYRLSTKAQAGQLLGKLRAQVRILDGPLQGVLCRIEGRDTSTSFALPLNSAFVANSPGLLCPNKGNRADHKCGQASTVELP